MYANTVPLMRMCRLRYSQQAGDQLITLASQAPQIKPSQVEGKRR
jgi:hypothetical protein